MHTITRLGCTAGAALAATAVLTAPADAAVRGARTDGHDRTGGRHAVFVQTDNPAGNQVAAYHRAPDGTLTPAGLYDTGGLGGILAGSVADHLASQGSLTYDARHALLYAVNAGSDTVSVFSVDGDRLHLRCVREVKPQPGRLSTPPALPSAHAHRGLSARGLSRSPDP